VSVEQSFGFIILEQNRTGSICNISNQKISVMGVEGGRGPWPPLDAGPYLGFKVWGQINI